MRLYLDTSALVKRFIEEEGLDLVFDAMERSAAQSTHRLAYAEACSAFARVERDTGRPGWYERLRGALDQAWVELDLITPNEDMVRHAGTRVQRFALRAYDSIHRAAAEAVHQHGYMTFVCFDRHLAAAASELGLSVVDGN